MNALFFPVGSAGDVHPHVGIALAMKKRGHRVTVITNGYFRDLVERAGLTFGELGSAEEFLRTANDPELWHPIRSFHVVARSCLALLRPMYQAIADRAVPGDTVVVAGSLAFAALIAEEKLNLPTALVHLQPSVFRSVYDPPVYAGLEFLPSLPPWGVRPFFRLIDFLTDRVLAPDINAFRRELGLAPVRRIMGDAWRARGATIGLFPSWFAPAQRDWDPSVRLTGFPLFDGAGVEPMAKDLDAFLSEGESPVVFTAGSAMRVGQKFFRESAEACRLLGRRGVLITRFGDQLPPRLAGNVHHFDYASFGALFPRTAAIVHHGGIGTTAQALRSGRPQLIVPMTHDQPDNAAHVKRLGAGRALRASRYNARRAACVLKELIGNPDIEKACAEVAARFTGASPVEQTCDLLEGLLNRTPR